MPIVVTCDAIAVGNRCGYLETASTTCSTGTPTRWLQASCQPLRTPQNIDDPKDIEYRVKDHITEHSETYN